MCRIGQAAQALSPTVAPVCAAQKSPYIAHIEVAETVNSFERPTKDDFLRILMGISEEARAAADAKALEIQTTFIRANGIGSSRYPIALAAALLPTHKACVDRAMEFTAQFANRSGLNLDELCDAASEFLTRRIVVFSAPILRAMGIPSDASHQSVSAAERKQFEKQIEEATQNLRIGFIGDRSLAMNPEDTIQAKALKLLKAIYEQSRSNEQPVFVEQLGAQLGIYIDDVHAAWRYLKEKDLIRTYNIPYTAGISATGIDAIEAAQLQPNKPTPVFPSITYNVTIHGTGAGTQVNVSSAGSTQLSQVTNPDPAAMLQQFVGGTRQLLEQLQQLLPSSSLPKAVRDQVDAEMVELQSATGEPTPKMGRVRRSLEALSRILEKATEDLVAAGARAAIQSLLGIPLN